MKMQSIMRIAMALVIAFGVETTASAQLGGLKGLAKKAKKAVEKVEKTVKDVNDTKDKVSNQAETAVSETNNESSVESSSSSDEPKKVITQKVTSYKGAEHVVWDYTSSLADVKKDLAYWLLRLRKSAEKNDPSALDMEALERLTTGKPSFDYMDPTYYMHDMYYISNLDASLWKEERETVVRAAMEVRDGVNLDGHWEINNSTDAEKALKKEITNDIHKAHMLKLYKLAAEGNRYKPAISGNDAWLTKLANENFPEWGKVVASKISTNYKVNYSSPGIPKSRYHSGTIMCEDQGYKVLHYIQLSQPYLGNGKYGNSEVRYGGMKWNELVDLVK